MEDLSVKTNAANPATGAGASAATLKDSGNSPADALALAFNQFLRKAAAKPDQMLSGARGQVIPFQFALGTDKADSQFTHAGFEPAKQPAPRSDAAPAPRASSDYQRPPASDQPKPAETSTPTSRDNSAPAGASDQNETRGENAQSANTNTVTRAETKSDGNGRQGQTKGQAVDSVEGEDRGRNRKKKGVANATAKDQAEIVLTGLAVGVNPGEGKEHADDQADGPADQANDAATDPRDVAGVANALSQLTKQSRGPVRAGSNQEQVNDQAAASGAELEAAGEDDKAAARNAGASVETRARQVTDLAERIGAGTRLSVDVAVTDEANTLMSRPMVALIEAREAHIADAAQAGTGANASTPTDPFALSAGTHADGADALAERFAALAGITTRSTVTQAAAAANESAVQITTQGVAAGNGATARATEGPTQTNAPQNAQRPAASFRSEVLEQVSVTIQKAIKEGTDRITVQLRPAELGRIDVRIEVAGDGRTLVHVAADRSDTLDLLQKDARDLARALQDAGLRADAGNLQFSLREQAAENRGPRGRAGAANGAGLVDEVAAETAAIPAWTPAVPPGRVDIRA